MPPVDIKVKEEFKDKIFYRPERRKSPKDQQVIDNNGRRILDRGWGKLNPTSRHNINQVRVPRLDKDGVPIEGRDRVCLDLSWVNKIFETLKHPIPDIQEIIQVLADSKFFSELDLSEAYNQLRISDELSQYMTFTCSFGKVSMEVMPFGVVFASDIFQSRICDEFLEFLDLFLVIYIDNLIVHTTILWRNILMLLGRCYLFAGKQISI